MPGPVNEEQTVTLISSTSISEDGEITPGILPIPALIPIPITRQTDGQRWKKSHNEVSKIVEV